MTSLVFVFSFITKTTNLYCYKVIFKKIAFLHHILVLFPNYIVTVHTKIYYWTSKVIYYSCMMSSRCDITFKDQNIHYTLFL